MDTDEVRTIGRDGGQYGFSTGGEGLIGGNVMKGLGNRGKEGMVYRKGSKERRECGGRKNEKADRSKEGRKEGEKERRREEWKGLKGMWRKVGKEWNG